MYVSYGSTPAIRLNYSGIPLGRSGNGPQLVIPRIPANFLDAAKQDIVSLARMLAKAAGGKHL